MPSPLLQLVQPPAPISAPPSVAKKSRYALKAKLLVGVKAAGAAAGPFRSLVSPFVVWKNQNAPREKLLLETKAAGDAADPFQGLALPSAISRNQNVPREKRLLGRKAVGAVASLLPPFRGHS